MSRLIHSSIGVLALLFGLSSQLLAADWNDSPPKSYAVIVGVGEFADKQIKPRPSADEDAKAFRDVLADPKIGTIPAERVFLFTSKADEKRHGQVGTKEAILKTLKEVADKAGKEELIYLILIGEGGATGTQGCIFASDSTFKERAKTAISATDLESALKNIKSQLCTIFDINFKGFEAGEEAVLSPTTKDFTDLFLGSKGKDDEEDDAVKEGRVLIVSGRSTSDPIVIDKMGLFAKVAVDALKGAADKEGYEPDGRVTLEEFTKYIEKEVPILAEKHGKDTRDKFQHPFVIAGWETHFVMSYNPEVYPKLEERLKELTKLQEGKKISPEIAEEALKYIRRMPKLKALQELRKEYIAMLAGTKSPETLLADRTKILDGMKLDRKEAVKYADIVLEGLAEVREIFIKPTKEEDLIANGIKGLFHRVDEKMPEAIASKLGAIAGMRRSERIELLADARQALGKREDLDDYKDADLTFQMMTSKLGDAYTTYFDSARVEELKKQTSGSFSGIGVVIRADLTKDALRVVTPIRGSPAYKAGLRTGDLIMKIKRDVDREGKPLEKPEDRELSTKGMETTDAVKLITGKKGTNVTVVVEREGEKEPLEFTITRGTVEVESVLGYKRKDDDSWDYYIDPASKIAYIYLSQFSAKSDVDMEKALQKLEKDGVKGLILDLRFNPGGYLDVVHRMGGMFLEDGVVVSIRPRVEKAKTMLADYAQKGRKPFTRFPMACLINGESASASEILSACLQDHNRAVIMGERSYGKGSVQTIVPFPLTGGAFKVTIATFWRPNGKNLNKASTKKTLEEDWGVRPDSQYELKLQPQEFSDLRERLVNDWSVIPRRDIKPKEPVKPFTDRQLDMALEYLKSQIRASGDAPMKKAG